MITFFLKNMYNENNTKCGIAINSYNVLSEY